MFNENIREHWTYEIFANKFVIYYRYLIKIVWNQLDKNWRVEHVSILSWKRNQNIIVSVNPQNHCANDKYFCNRKKKIRFVCALSVYVPCDSENRNNSLKRNYFLDEFRVRCNFLLLHKINNKISSNWLVYELYKICMMMTTTMMIVWPKCRKIL